MDYNIIKSFIEQSPPIFETIEINISQKKKFIEKYIGDIFNKFNLMIDNQLIINYDELNRISVESKNILTLFF